MTATDTDVCPACEGEAERIEDCPACAGSGVVDSTVADLARDTNILDNEIHRVWEKLERPPFRDVVSYLAERGTMISESRVSRAFSRLGIEVNKGPQPRPAIEVPARLAPDVVDVLKRLGPSAPKAARAVLTAWSRGEPLPVRPE